MGYFIISFGAAIPLVTTMIVVSPEEVGAAQHATCWLLKLSVSLSVPGYLPRTNRLSAE